MTWGPRSCEQVPRRLGPPRPPRRARHRVASASCPVWGVEPPGAPLQSPRLVWGGGGRVRVRRHRRLRPLCRAPRDQPPNFFPGRRPLPRGRRWQPAGPQGARARRSRRWRRRRGSESGEVNRRSQSLDPGPGRARRARGSPACARARGSYPLASVALVELSDPGASQWPGGSSGSRPRVEGGAAAAAGAAWMRRLFSFSQSGDFPAVCGGGVGGPHSPGPAPPEGSQPRLPTSQLLHRAPRLPGCGPSAGLGDSP